MIPSRYEERHDLSDGKIAEIVLTVNNIAIETGEFALSKLTTGLLNDAQQIQTSLKSAD